MTCDRVQAVLTRWFPGQEIAIARAGSGATTPVFRARIGADTFYARLAEDPGERRDGEVAAHRALALLGLPIPSIVAYEAEPPELDRSIALTSAMPGVALADAPDAGPVDAIACAAGAMLAPINRVPVRGYGWVTGVMAGATLLAERATRAGWAAEYLAAAEQVATSGILPPRHVRRMRSAVEAWAALPGSPVSHLAHGDFDTTHIYVDPASGTFTGVIDLGEIRGADRWYDLGHLLLHDGEAGRPRLFPPVLDGYGAVIGLHGDVMDHLRLQATAIATRALAIQLGRAPSPYRRWLARRLSDLAGAEHSG